MTNANQTQMHKVTDGNGCSFRFNFETEGNFVITHITTPLDPQGQPVHLPMREEYGPKRPLVTVYDAINRGVFVTPEEVETVVKKALPGFHVESP